MPTLASAWLFGSGQTEWPRRCGCGLKAHHHLFVDDEKTIYKHLCDGCYGKHLADKSVDRVLADKEI